MATEAGQISKITLPNGDVYSIEDEKLKTAAITSGTTYYPTVGSDTTDAATKYYDKTGISYAGTNGTANGTNGNALLTLGNNTASTSANWKKGTVRLYGTTAYYTDLVSGAPSANRTITFPNATGTVALTSNIPSAGTSASAVGTTASGGSATTWSKSDHVHNITSSTITTALGYTPYNGSTNPNGYITNAGVTGVKGNSESSYRTGQVNLTAANVGAIPSNTTGNSSQLRRPSYIASPVNDITLDQKINDLRANRLAFLPADQIIIEKTTDGGTTWTDAGVADSTKTGLFSQTRAGVTVPLLNGVKNIKCGLRITFTAMKYNVPAGTAQTQKYNYWNSNYIVSTERYNQLKEMYFWVGTNSDTLNVKLERATGAASTTWSTIFSNENWGITGWSGNDYISFAQGVFGGSITQATNYWNYRLTFFTRGPGGSTTLSSTNTTSSQSIMQIRGYGDTWWVAGNKYAASDHLYSWDYLKNVTFPANVTATGTLNGSLAASNITGTLGLDHGGTGKTNGKDAANVLINALDTGSSTPADNDYYISQYVNGGTTTTTYHRRPMSALWSYVKSKIDAAGTYTNTDTKNTAGATTTGSTLYLIGTTQQTANPQTYTVGVNSNHLYFSAGLKSQAYYSDNKSYISQNPGSIYLSVEDEDYSAVNLDMVRGTIVLSNRGTYDLDLEDDNYILFDGQENEIRIRGLVTPTNDNDAATKEYVDDHSSDIRVSTAAVTSGTTYYPTVGSNTTSAATKYYDSTGFTYKATRGAANGTDGEATLTLGNSTASTAANWKQGKVVLYGTTAYATTLLAGAPTAARTITFPNATGTVALTSNIPDVSDKIDTAGTGLSKSGTTLNHSNSVTAQTTQAVYPIKIDAQGHISAYGSAVTIPSDTKNTAGSTDTSSKIFLIGATSQAANPQTYSHDTAYVGTDGKLYSASKVVLTGGSNAASSVSITPSTTAVYSMTSAGSVTAGTKASFTRGTFNQGTLPTMTWAMDSTDTKKLNITFSQGTLPTHAADSFTANTPTAVTLPGRSSAINAWTGYTAATAAAQVFTGTTG